MSRLHQLALLLIILIAAVAVTVFVVLPKWTEAATPTTTPSPTATQAVSNSANATMTGTVTDTVTGTTTVTVTPTATATRRPRAAVTPTVGPSKVLNAYFLDVGQGDSILLMGPDFTILIDAGQHDHSEVVPYLKQLGVKSIDLLVGTHPHADHIGQFPEVLKAFPVTNVWLSGDSNTTKTFEDTIDAIADSGAAYHEPRTGEVYELGSARIEVLNPTELDGDPNDGSVSFRLVFGDVAFMFTGDAEARTETLMVESGHDLHAQILKLGHHGSNTSSSLRFLEAVDPELAIWSAGIDNSYGHPSPETLRRLKELGIRVMGTAIDGTIVVTTDGKSYQAKKYVQPATPMRTPTKTPTPKVAPTRARSTATPTPELIGCRPDQVDINSAPVEELDGIIGIGPARAREIIELRPFSSIDDMVRISGITIVSIVKIKEQDLACVGRIGVE